MVYGVYAKTQKDAADRTWIVCGVYESVPDAMRKAGEMLAAGAFDRVEVAYVEQVLDKELARTIDFDELPNQGDPLGCPFEQPTADTKYPVLCTKQHEVPRALHQTQGAQKAHLHDPPPV